MLQDDICIRAKKSTSTHGALQTANTFHLLTWRTAELSHPLAERSLNLRETGMRGA